MAYLNTNARTVRPTHGELNEAIGRIPTLFGVFSGFVKDVSDVQRNGRLGVWIPEFGSAPDEPAGWVTVSYCSPFAGATNVTSASETNIQSFECTQTSYGMWAVPPDINNEVLIMFVNGDTARGIWIGCLYNQFVNNMVPTSPASAKTYQYPGKQVPAAEYNKWDKGVVTPDATMRPYNKTKFQGVGNQGLLSDPVRGVNTTSARRESPSQVFGILTPGPAIDPTAKPEAIRRKGGSALIMDDAIDSEYTKIETKSGAQIRIDESDGFVYLINRDGTGWVEMDAAGHVSVFGAEDISLRAQRDLNFRADRNINLEAGQDVYIKAAKDTRASAGTFTHDVNNKPKTITKPVYRYVGEGKGDGGNLVTQANAEWHSTTKKNAYITVLDDDLNLAIGNQILATTVGGGVEFKSSMGIKLTSTGSIDLVAAGNLRASATESMSLMSTNNVMICSKGQLSLNGDNAIAMRSLTEIGITGTAIFSNNAWFNEDIKVRKTVKYGVAVVKTAGTSKDTVQPLSPMRPLSARPSRQADVKALNEKLNILAAWEDDAKFIRTSESMFTTVSRLPTFEPCPEHHKFKLSSTSGPTDLNTGEYMGSSGVANSEVSQPQDRGRAGEGNNKLDKPVEDSVATKDFDMEAFKCQLKKNEGYRNVSYNDSRGLLTGGIGHLMLAPTETGKYPLGSPISDSQIDTWYRADSADAIKGAMMLAGPQVWESLSGIRKRALADLCYNLGKAKLGKFTKFLAAVKASDWPTSGAELRSSAWFGQVGGRGPRIITMITQNTDPHGCTPK